MNKSTLLLVAGFLLFGSGLFAILLLLTGGVQLNYLQWIDGGGASLGFLIRIALVMVGAVLIVLGITDWDRERREVAEYLQAKQRVPTEVRDN